MLFCFDRNYLHYSLLACIIHVHYIQTVSKDPDRRDLFLVCKKENFSMARNRNRKRNRTKERMSARKARPFTVALSEPELTPSPLPALAPAVTAEPEKKDNPLTREQKIKVVLMALDGYSNAAAFLGDDSPLLASGTYRRSGLTSNTELLTVAYRENWLAKKIIDMPSEDMTRSWYSLSTSMPEEDIHDLKRLEAKHSVKIENIFALIWFGTVSG
jgi:hypothetical protein